MLKTFSIGGVHPHENKLSDVVKVGTKIAEPGGFVSAAIHSSVSGKVAKIDTVIDASGYPKPAIFIDVDGD